LFGCHTALEDVMGRAAIRVRDQLSAVADLRDALGLLEQLLLANAPQCFAPHPSVAHALKRFAELPTVRQVVAESGYSHRRFNDHFVRATGMTPKLYCRVVRFERLLTSWAEKPDLPSSRLAAQCGYSDQAHLSREFRDFAGITISEYRRLTAPGSRHVPLVD
jgi:AraC-like DNA-binding protein